MSVEVLGAFLTALNTIMLFRVIFNDLHQLRRKVDQLHQDLFTHITQEASHG